MNVKFKNIFFFLMLTLFLTYEEVLFAYIGPGLALGTIVVSIGLVLILIFLVVAILYYPIKKIILKFKQSKK
tara:strand:- start:46 stop:261 length:216 start_codon:yes stop_codon:yes gene_type:complete